MTLVKRLIFQKPRPRRRRLPHRRTMLTLERHSPVTVRTQITAATVMKGLCKCHLLELCRSRATLANMEWVFTATMDKTQQLPHQMDSWVYLIQQHRYCQVACSLNKNSRMLRLNNRAWASHSKRAFMVPPRLPTRLSLIPTLLNRPTQQIHPQTTPVFLPEFLLVCRTTPLSFMD